MNAIVRIQSITHLMQSFDIGKPKHPLVSVIDLSKISIPESMSKVKLVNGLYGITIKTKDLGELKYGRNTIDFEEGCLHGIAPEQTIEIESQTKKGDLEGWALYFHPDILKAHALEQNITNYGFFEYQTDEALHLSETERNDLVQIFFKIKEEYEGNIDEYSREVILSNIDLSLSYIKRYYKRQFLTRNSINVDLLAKFERLINFYFKNEDIQEKGLPTVKYFSSELNLSASYLSDLLKKETGKSTQEHIHFQLIKKAKYLLLNSNFTVAEVAYHLGFEHPPYFSRLFKKKIGMTPTEYRTTMN